VRRSVFVARGRARREQNSKGEEALGTDLDRQNRRDKNLVSDPERKRRNQRFLPSQLDLG